MQISLALYNVSEVFVSVSDHINIDVHIYVAASRINQDEVIFDGIFGAQIEFLPFRKLYYCFYRVLQPLHEAAWPQLVANWFHNTFWIDALIVAIAWISWRQISCEEAHFYSYDSGAFPNYPRSSLATCRIFADMFCKEE